MQSSLRDSSIFPVPRHGASLRAGLSTIAPPALAARKCWQDAIVPPGLFNFSRTPALCFAACRAIHNRASGAGSEKVLARCLWLGPRSSARSSHAGLFVVSVCIRSDFPVSVSLFLPDDDELARVGGRFALLVRGDDVERAAFHGDISRARYI